MQKIADAADEFMEKVAVPRVNNSEIAKLVRTKYRTLDLKVLGDFLDKANVLKFEALATGLFSAAGLRGEMARESGYGNVWVRDNVFVAHALVLAGREPQADAAVSALARFFCNHSRRFTDIIEGAVDPSDVRLRPNVRLDGVTLSEIEQKWAHAQNDALGYFLWLYCLRVATKSITADAAMLEMFVLYFERIEYWHDPDSGDWEEARKVEASSIGPVVAGLTQLRRLHDNKVIAASGRPALSPDRLGALIAKGQDALKGLLPWESLGPPDERARRYDAALLFLVYPLGVVDRTMAVTICEDVATHLQGDFGIKRYLGDAYWTEDYKDKLPPSERTADFSDRQKERDALAVPGMEAQWCIFDPILSAIWGQRYEKTKSSADLRRQIHFFNRSIGQITEGSRPQDNLKRPEAYYVQHGKYVPNDNVPLLWTQANLLTAFIWMQKSVAVQAGACI